MNSSEEVIRGKWKMAKPFYEKHYKVKFHAMPKARDVDFLYKNMISLRESLADHMEASRNYLEQINRRVKLVRDKSPL